MNTRILHIATNTFREAVRDRVLYNLIAFALLLTGAAVLIGQISITTGGRTWRSQRLPHSRRRSTATKAAASSPR